MHTVPRRDPRFNGFDHIRLFENNLGFNDKRLVVAWFLSMIPLKEPKVDVLQLILDLAALIPVAGTAAKIFEISLETAQIIKDIAEIIGLEFEEEDVELARLKFELETLEEEFRAQRQELLETQLELDREREQGHALRGTIELLEDENRRLALQVQGLQAARLPRIRDLALSILGHADRISSQVPLLPAGGPRGIIRGRTARIQDDANDILGRT